MIDAACPTGPSVLARSASLKASQSRAFLKGAVAVAAVTIGRPCRTHPKPSSLCRTTARACESALCYATCLRDVCKGYIYLIERIHTHAGYCRASILTARAGRPALAGQRQCGVTGPDALTRRISAKRCEPTGHGEAAVAALDHWAAEECTARRDPYRHAFRVDSQLQGKVGNTMGQDDLHLGQSEWVTLTHPWSFSSLVLARRSSDDSSHSSCAPWEGLEDPCREIGGRRAALRLKVSSMIAPEMWIDVCVRPRDGNDVPFGDRNAIDNAAVASATASPNGRTVSCVQTRLLMRETGYSRNISRHTPSRYGRASRAQKLLCQPS